MTYAPTLISEVTSSSTRIEDRNTKMKLYEANGVRYYLLANPDKKTLECFELNEGRYLPKKNRHHFQLTNDCSIEIDENKLW